MLKKNVIKEARAMRETDIGVWVTSLMLLFLALFAVICLYAGINNYKCIQSYTRSNLICYSGTASDIVGATGRSGKVSWRGPNTYIITLDNSDTVFFDCSFYNGSAACSKYIWNHSCSSIYGNKPGGTTIASAIWFLKCCVIYLCGTESWSKANV